MRERITKKHKVIRRKKVIKIIAEITERKLKKTIAKINTRHKNNLKMD